MGFIGPKSTQQYIYLVSTCQCHAMRAYPLVTFVTEYTSTPTLEVIPCLAFSHAHSHNLPHTHKNHPNHHKLYSSPSAILLSLKKKTPLPLPLYITKSESYLKSTESTRQGPSNPCRTSIVKPLASLQPPREKKRTKKINKSVGNAKTSRERRLATPAFRS